jgi:hypothetical protein
MSRNRLDRNAAGVDISNSWWPEIKDGDETVVVPVVIALGRSR